MTDRPKILLIGPGALGLFYTSRLADKAEISVAARSDYETAKARGGYQILSKQHGDFFFRPASSRPAKDRTSSRIISLSVSR